jgi:hypothetical protein
LSRSGGYRNVTFKQTGPDAVNLDCHLNNGFGTFLLTGNDSGTVREYGESLGNVEDATASVSSGWCALYGLKKFRLQHYGGFLSHPMIYVRGSVHMTQKDVDRMNKRDGVHGEPLSDWVSTLATFDIPENTASAKILGLHEAPVLIDGSGTSYVANSCSFPHKKSTNVFHYLDHGAQSAFPYSAHLK